MGAHVADVVVDDEVTAFDKLDAHLAGEVGVLKVGGVEDAGGEQHDVGFGAALGRKRAERREQDLRVVFDGADVVVAEELREDALHDAAIGEHVTHAAGNAQVVFKDNEVAVLKADEIRAANGDVDVARDLKAGHLAAKLRAGIDELTRDDAVGEDAAFVVDVFEEEVQGADALRKAAFDDFPFLAGDDARQEVVGEDALGAFVFAVDVEGDALVEEAKVGGLLAALDFFRCERGEEVEQRPVVRMQHALAGEHLVVGVIELVVAQRVELEVARRIVRRRIWHVQPSIRQARVVLRAEWLGKGQLR